MKTSNTNHLTVAKKNAAFKQIEKPHLKQRKTAETKRNEAMQLVAARSVKASAAAAKALQ